MDDLEIKPLPPPVYLVCRKCGTREVVLAHTEIVGCKICGAPRFAEDADGKDVFMWSEPWTRSP